MAWPRMRFTAVISCHRLLSHKLKHSPRPVSTPVRLSLVELVNRPFFFGAMSSTTKQPTNDVAPSETAVSNQDTATFNNSSSTLPNNHKKRKQDWLLKKQQKKKDKQKRVRKGRDDETWQSQDPHAGSFANPAMQQQFHVTVPTLTSTSTSDNEATNSDNVKIPKRKVAILMAYTGTNYGGFQINQQQRTIHAELELALYKAQFLSPANFGFPHKYSWSTSARTDKGVHACAQVVSAKLCIGDDMDAARTTVNAHLPPDIRVLDIVKTSRAFCAKTQRDRVRYTYMIPSFLLYNRNELRDLFKSVLGQNVRENRKAKDPLSTEESAKLAETLYKYRATPQQLQDLQEALSVYQGTKSFHNFTNRKSADDADAQRYIISFTTQEPILMEGLEWIPTQVVGQSFLLHQIRKMVSLAIDVVRGSASLHVMQHALSPATLNLNMAPAQGLFLDMSIFEGYNRRKTNEHLGNLDWVTDESKPAVQRWKDFRQNVVMKHIGKEEATQGNFIRYLYVQEYVYDCKNQYNVDTKETASN